MVKNVTGGNKHKKHKNKAPTRVEAKIVFAEQTQVYALVNKIMGGKHLQVLCSDGETRMCTIEGKHYKRLWIRANDIILCNVETIGLQKKCYMVLKYSLEHISILRNQKLLGFLDKEHQEIHASNESDGDDVEVDDKEDNCDDSDDNDDDEDDEDDDEKNYYDIDNSKPNTKIANFNNSDGDDDSDDSDYGYKGRIIPRSNKNEIDDSDLLNL